MPFPARLKQVYSEIVSGVFALRIPNVRASLLDIGTVGFKSPDEERYHQINMDALYQGMAAIGGKDLAARESFTQITCMMMVYSWELLLADSEYPRVRNDPIVQYFRHLRNACAHGNRFEIRNPLKLSAEWGGRQIDIHLHGHQCIPDQFGHYDLLSFLNDVSQHVWGCEL